MEVTCDYCGRPAKLITGSEMYPHRPDLAHIRIWECKPCKASVGCHKNSRDHKPLGRLANAELKAWKIRAHAAFDPMWKSGAMKRKEAYEVLRVLLGMDRQPHMGWMDLEQCKKVVALLERQPAVGG